MARSRDLSAAVGVFVGVLLSLQIFLLTVGLDALHASDATLAWTSAALSVLLAAGSAGFFSHTSPLRFQSRREGRYECRHEHAGQNR